MGTARYIELQKKSYRKRSTSVQVNIESEHTLIVKEHIMLPRCVVIDDGLSVAANASQGIFLQGAQ